MLNHMTDKTGHLPGWDTKCRQKIKIHSVIWRPSLRNRLDILLRKKVNNETCTDNWEKPRDSTLN